MGMGNGGKQAELFEGKETTNNIKGDHIKFGSNTKSEQKLSNQMEKRGWDKTLVKHTVDSPYTTRNSINKATGNPATVYYRKTGSYVIVDNVTKEIVQISDNVSPTTWIPDENIINPYIPNRGAK